MRIERLSLTGLLRFTDRVTLDLRDVEPGLIAISGPNGAGKTTLLEGAPAAIYRAMPSRDGKDPVLYATGRDSSIELDFSVDGRGAFRARVNMDGPKRASDAVLEQVQPNGTRVPLNDGKVSTYGQIIATLFPSRELFLASSFAAQGKADDFTKKKPSERKAIFAEFLGLQRFEVMSQTASQAAAMAEQARIRLGAARDVLARDTADSILAELDRLANDLQATGGGAEVERQQLRTRLEDLEGRSAMIQDQVAAFAAARLAVQTLERELAGRRADLDASRRSRATATEEARRHLSLIEQRRDAQIQDIVKRIKGNEQILGQSDDIRAAVAALADVEARLEIARGNERADQENRDRLTRQLAAAESVVNGFTGQTRDLARARVDAQLLGSVPCGGTGDYAACQFLVNATDAAGKIATLEAQVAGMTAAIERRQTLTAQLDLVAKSLASTRETIAINERERARHQVTAKYETPLVEAETRLTELRTKQAEAEADALRLANDAQDRHAARLLEFDAADQTLTSTIARLESDHKRAQGDLDAAGAGNTQAVQLQAEMTAARGRWDSVTATLATVASRRQELERRRADVGAKRAQFLDVESRIGAVTTILLEWQSLAQALGRGGLPDLEIDAAGPTVSATTNELLNACFGTRFTVDLVTQVEKADGKGMRDLFTVRVFDNKAGGDWRDIADLSGGEKVIVSEALMNAIALYVNQRSPMPIRTLWRDETTGALDPENATRYIEMLRKVRTIGGIHHVIFISHNPDAAAMADAQIQVSGGRASIVYPPYAQQEAA